jgi:hypothetical protein
MPALHPRQAVIDSVIARLTGATVAGSRVEDTRVEPYVPGELPAISVYALREPVRPESAGMAPRELTRDVKVEIVGQVAHTAALPVGKAMNAIALEIETAMDADQYLGGAAGDSILEDTEMEIRDEGDPLVGVVVLTYSVTYRTSPAAPGDLDDFRRVGATTQIVGADEDNTVSDLVVVQPDP